MPSHLLVFLTVAAWATAASAQDASARSKAWSDDLDYLRAQIVALHPKPFHGVPAPQFDAALQAVSKPDDTRSDAQVVVDVMRVVALLGKSGGEGHCAVFPTGFRHVPLQLYEFDEGVFVVGADRAHEDLVGRRLVSFDGHPIEALLQAVAPLVAADNPTNARVKRLMLVRMTDLLHALGLTEDPGRVRAVLCERASRAEQTVELAGLSTRELHATLGGLGPILPADDGVRHLAHRDEAFRLEYLAEHNAAYIQYHAMQTRTASGENLTAFAARLAALAAEHPGLRVVIDMRHNGGGDNTTYRPLLLVLRDTPTINAPDRLFVLTSRTTFSAAGNFVTEVERDCKHALLVGEACGGAPNQYGDARPVRLPNHPDVMVFIATRYHEKSPGDDRLEMVPQVPVAFTAADYFGHRDPVLDAALAHGR